MKKASGSKIVKVQPQGVAWFFLDSLKISALCFLKKLLIKSAYSWLSQFWKLEMPMILVCKYGLLILWWKDLKRWNVKKNNSKCTKFTTKILN